MDYTETNSVIKSYFNGSRRFSNIFWALAVSLGGFGFFLTGLDLSCSPNGRKYTYAQCRQEQIPIRHWNRESRTIVAPLDCLIAANPQVNHGRKVAVLSMR